MPEGRAKRKLSAILSADVKGYSRLMADDEEATVRTINVYREVMTAITCQYSSISTSSKPCAMSDIWVNGADKGQTYTFYKSTKGHAELGSHQITYLILLYNGLAKGRFQALESNFLGQKEGFKKTHIW